MTDKTVDIMIETHMKTTMSEKDFNNMALTLGGEDAVLRFMAQMLYRGVEDSEDTSLLSVTASKGNEVTYRG